MGFDAQTGFSLAEQAVALRDALEGRHQFDEQNDVLWSRLWWRWELNLFLHKEKPCRTLPVTTGLISQRCPAVCAAKHVVLHDSSVADTLSRESRCFASILHDLALVVSRAGSLSKDPADLPQIPSGTECTAGGVRGSRSQSLDPGERHRVKGRKAHTNLQAGGCRSDSRHHVP